MHFTKTLASLAILAISTLSTAIEIEFEFYPEGVNNCGSGSLSATFLTGEGCRRLANTAESFHIGGPTTESQVPEGCTIVGYDSPDCTGSVGLIIHGPSSGATCYISGIFQGTQAKVGSVSYTC